MGKNGNGHREELMPINVEAEEAVLGGILIDNHAMVEASTIVGPDDFSREKNRWIFEAYQRLDRREAAIDFVTVCDELDNMGRLDDVGGPAFITSLLNAVPTSVHTEHYANIIYRTSVQRQLIQTAGQIAALAYRPNVESAEDLMAQAEQMLGKIGEQLRPKTVNVHNLIERMREEVWSPTGNVAQRVFTGFPGIDGPMLGIESGRFWAMAAVPGTGKTTMALNLVRGVARTNKGRVAILYFHPEQPEDEITQLIWCSGTEIVPPIRLKALMAPKDQRDIYVRATGFVSTSTQARGYRAGDKVKYLMKDPKPEEIAALDASCDELGSVPIILNNPSGKNIHQIVATIRRVRNKLPDDIFLLVVFDGAHLIPGAGEGNRYAELVTITRNLKMAAMNVVTRGGDAAGAIIANTQLNRSIFQNGGNRVYRMSYLRDSGSWEADSDAILFIDRPSVFENGNGNGAGSWDPFTVIAKKNRQTSQLFTTYWQMHRSTMKVKGRDLT